MSKFYKNRPRVLIISRNPQVQSDLVMLFTGYGYFVDYVKSRSEGISKFRQNKQPIVVIDVPALPRFPDRMFRLFKVYRRNPIILVAAHADEEKRVYRYLNKGVYDILSLPIKSEMVHHKLRRLVDYNQSKAQNEFMRTLITLTLLITPIWLFLYIFIIKQFF